MEEEVVEVNSSLNISNDDELFDSTLLDSLNKLTDEIQEDLLTDGESEESDSYDSDEYTDDDEDPDSGENQLFTMMDDLVMELQMELKDEAPDESEQVKADADTTIEPEKEGVCQEDPNVQDEATIPKTVDEPQEMEDIPVLGEPTAASVPPVDPERMEKQRRLHLQVKTLLQQVTVMTRETEEEEHQAVGGRKRGDSSADKLERLLGALSSCSNPPIAQHSAQNHRSEEQAKTARAMSNYTQRKRREYLLRKQASRGENTESRQSRVTGQQSTAASRNSNNRSGTPSTSPRSSKGRLPNQNEKKTKRKPRTNKHKKRKPRVVSPDASRFQQQQQSMDQQHHYQQQQQQQAYYAQQHAEHAAHIPQQSLRALLASLLALDEKLSREQMI